eukprot:CAMPEP_0182885642 /NCGR_PEP_ID=MMETSP0034_2-20130328/19729_1 /TAXON_ID=156128 /ORGANISM="Nephroselmis pyriformis, Strain CCMP717" /LENGTH=255 /DNA_ID=CAMNT_0025018917 /DNA_START=190 /DNA_END=957 /DNA_ORIENTATION=-
MAGAVGYLGPRLAGRLTAELILRSPQYMNAVKEYEIDLRGNKIGAIENLGATEDQFDCLDLSDNEIVKLEGFPMLPRLKTLLLNNNRIARIGSGLEEGIPKVETLVLTNNRINNLTDIHPLVSMKKLLRLSLLDNPITKKKNYRLYVIFKIPQLKLLDFRKVKPKEREEAAKMFAGEGAAEAAAAKTFTPGEVAEEEAMEEEEEEAPKTGPTPQQLLAIKMAIANAATLDEVSRLENALKTGVMPSGLGDGMEEG